METPRKGSARGCQYQDLEVARREGKDWSAKCRDYRETAGESPRSGNMDPSQSWKHTPGIHANYISSMLILKQNIQHLKIKSTQYIYIFWYVNIYIYIIHNFKCTIDRSSTMHLSTRLQSLFQMMLYYTSCKNVQIYHIQSCIWYSIYVSHLHLVFHIV